MGKDSSTPKKKAALPNKLPSPIKDKILKMTKKIEKKENIMKALKKSQLASSAAIQIEKRKQAALIHQLNQRDIILETLKNEFRKSLTKSLTRMKNLEIIIENQSKTIRMLQNKCKKESKRKPSASKKKRLANIDD